MKITSIVIFLGLFVLLKLASAADVAFLLQSADEYNRDMSRVETSGKTTSLEKILQQGNKLAAELKPVIEQLSKDDYATIEKNMKGYFVSRAEVILVEPDIRFFSKLADKIGTSQDLLYFNFMLKVKPEGYWPVYITRQTDLGGCIDFGNGSLSRLFQEGTDILPKLAGYYRQQLDRTIDDVAHQLTAGKCACGTIESVKKELQSFLVINPKAHIADRIRARMEAIQRGDHNVKENCIGGR